MVTVVELGLEDLQVAHLETRRSERNLLGREWEGLKACRGMPGCAKVVPVCVCVRTRSDLKVHGNGRPGPFLLIVGRQ